MKMVDTPESLEERLYNLFYERFERDKEREGEGSKSLYDLGRYSGYIAGIAALLICGNIIRRARKKEKVSRREFIQDGSLAVAVAGLTVHLQKAKEIFGQMYRKNTGEELTQEEIENVKTDGQIGRAAHYVGAAGLGISITSMVTMSRSRREFLSFIPFFTIAPFWYYYTLHKGYNSLYSSAVDYTVGERRFKKQSPQK